MNARTRQNTIINFLRRNNTSTIAQLGEVTQASRRTIIRDLNELRDRGYVIEAEPGRGGGIQLDVHSMQTSVRLSVYEVFALVISAASMTAIGTLPFTSVVNSALSKIENALPPEKLRDLRQLLSCLFVGELAAGIDLNKVGIVDSALLEVFETTFTTRHCIQFSYCDANGAQTNRLVEPQAVLILPPLWYLVAWDPSKSDFRHFRMDRITHPQCHKNKPFLRRYVPFDIHVTPLRNLAR